MRSRTSAFAALVAASAATAQGPARWEIEIDNPVLLPGSSSTDIRLWFEPPPGDFGLAGVNFSMHADQGAWSDLTTLIPHPGQVPGIVSGTSVMGISVGQLDGFGFEPTPGRIAVWQGTFTADFPYTEINFWTETTRLEVYPMPIHGRREPRDVIEGQAQIVIPAPGALAMLGAAGGAGLVAVRRRRA